MKIVDKDDRRLHPRIVTDLSSFISTGYRRIRGTVLDVSISGARVAWHDALERVEDVLTTGQFIDLEVAKNILIQGAVVRIDNGTFAIAFNIADDELPLIEKQMSELVGHEFRAA